MSVEHTGTDIIITSREGHRKMGERSPLRIVASKLTRNCNLSCCIHSQGFASLWPTHQ